MKKNVGKWDRIIRVAIAIIIAVLYFANIITGTWATILLVLGLVLLLTSLVSVCPLYKLLGISTRKES